MSKRLAPIFAVPDENVAAKRVKGDSLTVWSWNVAGLRACIKKEGAKVIEECGADIVVLQETKCSEWPPEIQRISAYPFKKLCVSKERGGGYSGVGFLAKHKPRSFHLGIGDKRFDDQGRYVHAEYEDFHIVGVYVPNSGSGLKNLDLRKEWDELIREKLAELDKTKPVIFTGDLNVAHQELDIKNVEKNRNKSAGFTDVERAAFSDLLASGFVDVFRKLNPDAAGQYTYWSYFGNSRPNNTGWRLDYFVLSERAFDKVEDCTHHTAIEGSDHCPISLKLRSLD